MTLVQSLEEEVKRLSPTELRTFRDWFMEWDADAWDHQIEQDAQTGKLDALAAEALAEYHSGKCTEI